MNLKWEIRIFINHIRSIQRQDFPRVSTFVFLSFLRNRCWKGNVATIPHTQSILNPLTISRAIRANDLIKRMGFCRISTSPSSMPPLSPAQGVEFRSSRRPPIVHRNRSNVLTPRVITLLAPGNSRRTHRFLSNPPPPNLTLRPVSNEHVSVHVGKRDGNVRSNIPPHSYSTLTPRAWKEFVPTGGRFEGGGAGRNLFYHDTSYLSVMSTCTSSRTRAFLSRLFEENVSSRKIYFAGVCKTWKRLRGFPRNVTTLELKMSCWMRNMLETCYESI